jgi:helicase required for RNAi-mediated heterochromatin assembly 1
MAICSDNCRCQVCERRGNGTKSMLKTVPNGVSSRQPSSATYNPLVDTTYQMPANPVPMQAPRTPEPSTSSGEKWQAHVNGGVAKDDAHYVQKAREEQAKLREVLSNTPPHAASSKPAKLIEVSPEKKAVSKNANLLIDLDLDLGQAPTPMGGQRSYANTSASNGKGKAVAKANTSLLD